MILLKLAIASPSPFEQPVAAFATHIFASSSRLVPSPLASYLSDGRLRLRALNSTRSPFECVGQKSSVAVIIIGGGCCGELENHGSARLQRRQRRCHRFSSPSLSAAARLHPLHAQWHRPRAVARHVWPYCHRHAAVRSRGARMRESDQKDGPEGENCCLIYNLKPLLIYPLSLQTGLSGKIVGYEVMCVKCRYGALLLLGQSLGNPDRRYFWLRLQFEDSFLRAG